MSKHLARAPPKGLSAGAFSKWWPSHSSLQRVALLKAIEQATAELFEKEVLDKEPSEERRKQFRAAVLESNLGGMEEFGAQWYECIAVKMTRMVMCAEFIELALDTAGDASGFDAFERALIVGAAKILPSNNQYYFDFLQAVQDEKVGEALKASPPPSDAEDIHSHYTIVRPPAGPDGAMTAVPFATHFKELFSSYLARFDEWISACRAAEAELSDTNARPSKRTKSATPTWSAEARSAYTAFLLQYRDALALDGTPAELEAAWAALDRRWMECAMPIQLVHDIETGYGDPLRVKATPDMSLRFLDETFAEENATIADIQQRLEAWYTKRDTPLGRSGLKALSSTLAGIYFIPFKTGMSLQFSFSGQSIPNRQDVAQEKGIKIYFDAVETAARVEINKVLIVNVFHEANLPGSGVLAKFPPDAIEQLVWHVAAHEVGHAIYNLGTVIECFSSPAYESLLEEPRAELTAMFTLRLLHEQGVLTRDKVDMALAHFCVDALRYFDKYDSEALRPYIIFQVYAYKVYHKHGYLTIHPTSGKLVLDASKTLEVLDTFVDCFERLLGHMDEREGAALEDILFKELAPEDAFVREVLALVRAAKVADGAPPPCRPERGCSCHPTWALPLCMVCQPVA